MCVALQCILVAGGLDVRQGSIWDYRDTVTGQRADTGHLGILRTGYCKEYKQVLCHVHLKILGTVIWSTSVNRCMSTVYSGSYANTRVTISAYVDMDTQNTHMYTIKNRLIHRRNIYINYIGGGTLWYINLLRKHWGTSIYCPVDGEYISYRDFFCFFLFLWYWYI